MLRLSATEQIEPARRPKRVASVTTAADSRSPLSTWARINVSGNSAFHG
ncbi:hypothetical protein OHA10_26165 [Kribbella sp. NBC_00662]